MNLNLAFILTIGLMAPGMGFSGDGANSGGGGGGVCVRDKCMTLAEAGLRIQSRPNAASAQWTPSKEVEAELLKIKTAVPVPSYLWRQALGTSSTFALVDGIDEKKFKHVRKDYQKLLDRIGFKNKNEITIFAISNATQTFILPEFSKLSARQQALILIHEVFIRQHFSNLQFHGKSLNSSSVRIDGVKKALEFDGLLLDYLDGNDLKSFDYLRFLQLLSHPNFLRRNEYFIELLKYFENIAGKKLTLGDFINSEWPSCDQTTSLSVSGSLAKEGNRALIRSNSIHPAFSTLFGKSNQGWANIKLTFEKCELNSRQLVGFAKESFSDVCRDRAITGTLDDFVLSSEKGKVYAVDCSQLDVEGNHRGLIIEVEDIQFDAVYQNN